MWFTRGLFICFVFTIFASGEDGLPVATISQGTVIGSIASDGDYFEFYGIPYADSTSGVHRFKAPLPPPSFETNFIASRKDIKCVRALGVGFEGTEDCLVANIFTPTTDNTKQLPVMVWIRGTEFDRRNENLSFRNFVEKDVVVVFLNYRESVLGFLCLGTETAPGNAGLKDIVAGLRWVKENIAQFGGNPDDITLFGHGSGAAAVDLITMSSMAEGLVQKAIAQSGNAMAPWAVSRDNLKYALQVAEALGHRVNNIEELSAVFTRTSVAALMAVINELELTDNSLAFAPCIERPDLQNSEPFLLKTPAEIIADGDFHKIPFVIGFVDNEGTIRAEEALEEDWLERMENSFTDFIQPDLKFDNNEQENEIAQEIKTYYFGEDTIDMSAIDEYVEYQGDTMMLVSSIREARDRALASSSAIYLYQFSYKGTLGQPFVGPIAVESAAHSEELAYMFHDVLNEETPETPEMSETLEIPTTLEVPVRDLVIGDILVERWTNFAKTGNPTSETSQVLWQPFDALSLSYLRVLDNNEINDSGDAAFEVPLRNPHADTITFWEQIYRNHFFDAESNWIIIERDEDNSNETTTTESAATTTTPAPTTADSGIDNDATTTTTVIPEDTTTPVPDSASTAVGYTFLIVTMFSLLNKFHFSQILS